MNENQLSRARKDIQEVLDKLEIQAVSDPEDNKMYFAEIETADADGMMMNVCLYVTIMDKNEAVTLEMEIEDEIAEDKIVQAMELVNLINRQAIAQVHGLKNIYVHSRVVALHRPCV